MLSSSAQALDPSSNANLLVTQIEPEAEPSTLALLQKFLDQEQISVPLLSEISSEDISTGSASKFIDFLNKEVESKKIKPEARRLVIDADASVNQNDSCQCGFERTQNSISRKNSISGGRRRFKGDNILKSNSAIIENPATNFLARNLQKFLKW